MQEKCLYAILGLASNSSKKEIKKQFYKLSKLYHPDLTHEGSDLAWAKKKFNDIVHAYHVLSNDKLRREYDIQHGHVKLSLQKASTQPVNYNPPPPIYRPGAAASPRDTHQETRFNDDFRLRWERMERTSFASKETEKAEMERIKAMQREDYKIFRNRLIVLGAGFILYLIISE